MHLTETAADAAVVIRQFRFSLRTGPDDLLRTEGYADTAAFAPIMIKSDIKQFLFFCPVLHFIQYHPADSFFMPSRSAGPGRV